MVGYGENQLLRLLQTAATNVKKKATNAWQNRDKVPLPNAFNNYRYGQFGPPGSRTTSRQRTPAGESAFRQLSKARRSMQESFMSTASAMTDRTNRGRKHFLWSRRRTTTDRQLHFPGLKQLSNSRYLSYRKTPPTQQEAKDKWMVEAMLL